VSVPIKVELDGQLVALADCCWIHLRPCGCIAGVLAAAFGDEAFAAKEQALKEMFPLKRDRDRYTKPGWQFELVTFEQYKARFGVDAWKCPHSKAKKEAAS
jgi:hypothetical protein